MREKIQLIVVLRKTSCLANAEELHHPRKMATKGNKDCRKTKRRGLEPHKVGEKSKEERERKKEK